MIVLAILFAPLAAVLAFELLKPRKLKPTSVKKENK